MKITFDTNCLIDVAEGRASATSIHQILRAHRDEIVEAHFVAVSASERQQGDRYMESYGEFLERLDALRARLRRGISTAEAA